MAKKRLFSEEELEKLATPLSIRLERAADGKNWEEMKQIQKLMDQECLVIHEPYVNWLTALQTYIARRLGEDRMHEAVRGAAEYAMQPVWAELRELDRKGQIEYLASRWRASGSTFYITEDDEKLTFRMDPCGDGHRLMRSRGEWKLQRDIVRIGSDRLKYPDQGAYGPPKNFVILNQARPATHGLSKVPAFCSTCILFNEIMATDVFGYPLWVSHLPEKDPDTEPCVLYLYKDPRDVPVGAYLQIGKAKPGNWEDKPRVKRMFTDQELETLGTPLSLRLEQAIARQDIAAARELSTIMDDELVRAKDPHGIMIAGMLSYIARNMGEQHVEEALHWVAEMLMSEFLKDIAELDKKTEIEMWCMVWRAHGSTFWVTEDDEKFTFRGKPLGACHRMWSSAYQPKTARISDSRVRYSTFGCYLPPASFHLMREPRGITWMNTNYPVYSTHCHMLHEIYAIEQIGYPLWVEIHPLQDRDSETIHLHYKEAHDWPEDIYAKLGKVKPEWLRQRAAKAVRAKG